MYLDFVSILSLYLLLTTKRLKTRNLEKYLTIKNDFLKKHKTLINYYSLLF